MAMIKRIFLFLLTNFLVMLMAGIVISVLGALGVPLGQFGPLIVMALIFGMGGAFVSLLISRWMAKKTMGVQVIDPNVSNPELRDLVQRVHAYCKKAGLKTMPEVGIYDSPELNAFATGASARSSLVAVSTGLLRNMNRDQVDGVLAHEVSHIANGDMVTMTLLQGIVNAFVIFLANVVAQIAVSMLRGGRDEGGGLGGLGFLLYWPIYMALQTVFMLLGSIVIAFFSRWREYRADAGGAELAGKGKMIAALEALKINAKLQEPATETRAIDTLKISSEHLVSLFRSHPPLDKRIAALRG